MLRILLFLLLLVPMLNVEAKTICLNMIVKNESKIIRRCLESVKDIVDYWVIVDTGSTDGTQEIIKQTMQGKPGELHERPWVNFAHNRNEALDLAKNKADYLLFIDADEKLQFSSKLDKNKLTKDHYFCNVHEPQTRYQRSFLINNHLNWKWEGVLHEIIVGPPGCTEDLLLEVTNLSYTTDGARSQDPFKYKKDAEILKKALEEDPTNFRYLYFLGQSYLLANENYSALSIFEKCAKATESPEMSWYLSYMIARLHQTLNIHPELLLEEYCKIYQTRPTRVEPLYYLAKQALLQGNNVLGYALSQLASSIPLPENDAIHVEHWLYEYGVLCLLADCAYNLGRQEEAYKIYRQVLTKKDVPEDTRKAIEHALALANTSSRAKTIGIFTDKGTFSWDPDSVHSGITGSEEAVIYMSKQLSSLGHRVVVYGNPPPHSLYSQEQANPRFVPLDFKEKDKLDIAISWRYPLAAAALKERASKVYLWPHDTWDQKLPEELIHAFDDVLWLSS